MQWQAVHAALRPVASSPGSLVSLQQRRHVKPRLQRCRTELASWWQARLASKLARHAEAPQHTAWRGYALAPLLLALSQRAACHLRPRGCCPAAARACSPAHSPAALLPLRPSAATGLGTLRAGCACADRAVTPVCAARCSGRWPCRAAGALQLASNELSARMLQSMAYREPSYGHNK